MDTVVWENFFILLLLWSYFGTKVVRLPFRACLFFSFNLQVVSTGVVLLLPPTVQLRRSPLLINNLQVVVAIVYAAFLTLVF